MRASPLLVVWVAVLVAVAAQTGGQTTEGPVTTLAPETTANTTASPTLSSNCTSAPSKTECTELGRHACTGEVEGMCGDCWKGLLGDRNSNTKCDDTPMVPDEGGQQPAGPGSTQTSTRAIYLAVVGAVGVALIGYLVYRSTASRRERRLASYAAFDNDMYGVGDEDGSLSGIGRFNRDAWADDDDDEDDEVVYGGQSYA